MREVSIHVVYDMEEKSFRIAEAATMPVDATAPVWDKHIMEWREFTFSELDEMTWLDGILSDWLAVLNKSMRGRT